MDLHFTSFTAEWGRAFRKDLTAGLLHRRDSLSKMRDQTSAFLTTAAHDRRAALAEFRRTAHNQAEGRHLFRSELRSGVHALRGRFALNLAQMAKELRAASDAYHGRANGGAGASFNRTTWPTAQSSARSDDDESEFTATYDGRDATAGSKHSKKRHS